MQLLSVSCRNNPVAGIMPLIPPTELSAHLCGADHVELVSVGQRCWARDDQAHDMARSCEPCPYLLVSGGGPGIAGVGFRSNNGRGSGGRSMKATNFPAL